MAIGNGALCQLGYGPYMGEPVANRISCFTGIGIFFVYTCLIGRRWPVEGARQAAVIGFIWLVLTVASEFVFGHYAARKSWVELLNDYNVLEGRLWSLVLISLVVMPYVRCTGLAGGCGGLDGYSAHFSADLSIGMLVRQSAAPTAPP